MEQQLEEPGYSSVEELRGVLEEEELGEPAAHEILDYLEESRSEQRKKEIVQNVAAGERRISRTVDSLVDIDLLRRRRVMPGEKLPTGSEVYRLNAKEAWDWYG